MINDMIKTCFYNLLLLLACGMWAANSHAAKSPATMETAECKLCHIDWVPDYKNKAVATLVPQKSIMNTPSGRQKVASTKRMCFSCHDGYVNDSRYQFHANAHDHPIGVKPSKNIRRRKSPEGDVYPMNEDGKMYCGTCHTAHGNDWNRSESALFMRSKNINSSLCIDCHEKKDEKHFNNHPTVEMNETIPDSILKARSRFGGKRKVICQTCHRSHDAASKELLVIRNNNSELCTTCHKKKAKVVDTNHDLTRKHRHLKNAKGLEIGKNGPCSGCHSSHGGFGKQLLVTSKTVENGDVWMQCISCHNKNGIADKTHIGEFSHPVDVAISNLGIDAWKGNWFFKKTEQRLTALPLFDSSGKRVYKKGKVQCPTCHDTHNASKQENKFLRIDQGNDSQLCTNCHVNKANIANSKHNVNLYDKTKRAKLKHLKKDSRGICIACHSSHQGKAPNMLKLVDEGDTPSVSLISNSCKLCHTKDGAASETGTGEHSHPISVSMKDSEVPEILPLYNFSGKHARKFETGRVDCATCHNPHQWNPTKSNSAESRNLKAKAHGGNSFLRLPAAEKSELCLVCHEDQAQVVGTDHDLRISAPNTKNITGLNPKQSGVCGQCHTAHNAQSAAGLWARKPGRAKDSQATLCRSCHNSSREISHKDVPNGKHPDKALVWSFPRRKFPGGLKGDPLRVFTKEGKSTNVGLISCPSCHNPHQWNGKKPGKGIGRELEGNSMTSFLRKTSIDRINCADCHGLDGIFRFQYFHSRSNSKKNPLYIDLETFKAPGNTKRN